MQLANVMVKLGGDNNNIVPKAGVTPAEILVLRHIHGPDCVIDIRPAGFDKKRRHEQEYERLSQRYDRAAGSFTATAGEERKSVMATLFPGALRKLPMTLAEIGEGGAPAPKRVVEPDLPPAPEEPDDEITIDPNADDAAEGGGATDGENGGEAGDAEAAG